MNAADNRRPLNSRDTRWARWIARTLAGRGITPNQISQASMAMALIAGLAFWSLALTDNTVVRGCLLIVGALGCQLRLLCNLIDGMVAIEAGQGAPDGPFWNEFPDRISDILILAGVGLGIGTPALGFAAATIAVLAAYVRELGSGLKLPADFRGPMAKPHRMALITGAAVLSVVLSVWVRADDILTAALWVIVIGGIATVARRALTLRERLLAG
ncbi:CDP-alcohol phosphatidyltransferase family protein [Paracoccus pacificus]|uniref:CDP-alcohol phosphatidyltransferase family protein n=1 Tax=Paracoccus pacificus TaxID=1463598 RepID=A0ABW4R3U6_9RHOB